MQKNKIWIEGTIVAALALILSLIPLQIGSSFSISLGQIPLTLFALRRGWKAGVFSGLIWGLLHFPTGQVYFLSVIQVLIEYPIAFAFGGLAGFSAEKVQRAILSGKEKTAAFNIIIGTFIGVLARYFWALYRRCRFLGKFCVMGNESMDLLISNERCKRISNRCRNNHCVIDHLSHDPLIICSRWKKRA
jgi:thiamine transporter